MLSTHTTRERAPQHNTVLESTCTKMDGSTGEPGSGMNSMMPSSRHCVPQTPSERQGMAASQPSSLAHHASNCRSSSISSTMKGGLLLLVVCCMAVQSVDAFLPDRSPAIRSTVPVIITRRSSGAANQPAIGPLPFHACIGRQRREFPLHSSPNDANDNSNQSHTSASSDNHSDDASLEANVSGTTNSSSSSSSSSSKSWQGKRNKVKELARKFLASSPSSLLPMPRAIAQVLQEATMATIEEAGDAYISNQRLAAVSSGTTSTEGHTKGGGAVADSVTANVSKAPAIAINGGASNVRTAEELRQTMDSQLIRDMVEDAFAPMEESLTEMEESLVAARESLEKAKRQSIQVAEALQLAALAQVEGASAVVAQAEEVAERKMLLDLYSTASSAMPTNAVDNAAAAAAAIESEAASELSNQLDVSKLAFADLDFDSTEMAPPFLDPDSCLVPGEPVVRVEKAPENSRRIFAGIDIMASVDDVWKILTDYNHLQDVVPNLVRNDILQSFDGDATEDATYDTEAPEEVQCRQVADQMKGAVMKQVGGAKVAGINFSARTTLEVREWPNGMPDFAHFKDDMWEGKSRVTRAKEYPTVPLTRYRFPRPFALSSLPTKDISMQSVVQDDGEFRLYQGVWRMQPLPGCAPPGKQAMRLTYAVEISPRAYLPVRLVEGRIVKDLCTNLEAIRKVVSTVPTKA